MAQFTKYTSADVGAPQLTGRTGKLIAVLDWALVTGQSWTHPVATAGDIATYKPAASHSGATARTLLVNDANPSAGAPTFQEAWITGYASASAVGAVLGTGIGQFPLPAQMGTTGHLWVRKSVAVDDAARAYTIYADGRTFYMFVKSEAGTVYYCFGFGEFYSNAGTADNSNTFISGRTATGAVATYVQGNLDVQNSPFIQTSQFGGNFMADNMSGTGGSQQAYFMGDPGKQSGAFAASTGLATVGNMPAPNAADGAYYLTPLKVLDASGGVRGRMRGLYHLCHPLASFADGATFNGAGALAGKAFIVMKSTDGAGMVCLETSNTLDTN